MRRFLPSLVCLLLAATACGGGGGSSGGQADPIKVGLIVSLTGNYTPLGSEDKKAVELAVEQVNAQGGLLGRKVELITRDDKTAPDQGIVAYNQIKGEIDALIGPVFSNSALAVEPLAQRDMMPYLSLAPAQEQVEPIKSYIFVTPALSSMYAERYLQYIQAEGIKTIAVAWDSKSAYSVSGHKSMVELAPKYGVTIAVDEPYETTTSDFSAMFTHVRDSKAEALVFWGSGAPGVTAAKQYVASGLKTPLFLTASQASKLWLEPMGAQAEGMTVQSAIGVVGDHLPDGKQKQVIDQMATPYEQKHGYPPPQFAQDGYSASLLLFEAIRKANSTDKAKVQKALEAMDLITPNGRFRYSATDHSGLSPEYISVNTVQNGQFVPTEWAKEQLTKTVNAQG
ncbi:ABC transporter substrate-binding protein [Nonomuraea gerenzanensis]|uniref:Branched-chain amino acid ABC transporter, amino acid-binding protein (TC 3.A.1.4.1) n=1 Tax=Nonomuraea gerenzanensis TaxID=93944 RepID=A0A1M4E4B3_9ACTN|nr:ABC transporter substrate-binding protein [Nonomuraea gerenzanensis]UBU15908.1 ABC transporter substrate-binding protein [Nonomuraea gerenzanensis]SBO93705.1 Branched-chain amino acid ABC transporter, amino acid-binding protein (TC 3.A.1.4.1) [Nonomuraea gerenzanensis]